MRGHTACPGRRSWRAASGMLLCALLALPPAQAEDTPDTATPGASPVTPPAPAATEVTPPGPQAPSPTGSTAPGETTPGSAENAESAEEEGASASAAVAPDADTAGPEATAPVSPVPAAPPEPAVPAVPPAPPAGAEAAAPVVAPASMTPALLPEDDAARRAYASGVSLARGMQQSLEEQAAMGISLSPDLVMAGLEDTFHHRPLRMAETEIREQLAELSAEVSDRLQAHRREEETRGEAFRTAFSQQSGVTRDDGVLYRVADKGHGRRLRPTDLVTLLVTGRLPDGKLFDGSGEAGQTQTVRVGAVLPPLATGLQKVGVGGHITVVIPPEKGYGDAGLPPVVPGGATLVFDIRVEALAPAG